MVESFLDKPISNNDSKCLTQSNSSNNTLNTNNFCNISRNSSCSNLSDEKKKDVIFQYSTKNSSNSLNKFVINFIKF